MSAKAASSPESSAGLNRRIPGVSSTRPPSSSRISSREVVVCRPRPSARTSETVCRARPSRPLTRLDLPTPDDPRSAAVWPGPIRARTWATPSPVWLETGTTGVCGAAASISRTSSGASCTRSVLVRITTGRAPDSHAAAR